MSNQKQVFLHFILILFSNLLLGQNSDKPDLNPKLKGAIPSSPSAAALGQYGSSPVSLHTGVPSISIPLFNLTANKISLPISLDYHASGIKVGQIASNVGLGWSLNAGGVITREVRDQPDDAFNITTQIFYAIEEGLLNAPKFGCPIGSNSGTNFIPMCDVASIFTLTSVNKQGIGLLYSQDFVNTIATSTYANIADIAIADSKKLFGDANPNPISVQDVITAVTSITHTPQQIVLATNGVIGTNGAAFYRFEPIPKVIDTEPDIFNFNFAGYSGQFVYSNGQFKTLNDQDLKITYSANTIDNILTGTNLGTLKQSIFNGYINTFTIKTPNGYSYEFREREISISDNTGQNFTGDLSVYAPIIETLPPIKTNRAYTLQVLGNERNRAAVSAWYLSSIVNDMGQVEYKLEYDNELIMDHSQISQSFSGGRDTKITNSSNISINLVKRVSKINYFATDGSASTAIPTGFIQVNTAVGLNRADLYYPQNIIDWMATSNYSKSKAVKNIIWSINEGNIPKVVKSVEFNFDYFNKTSLTLPTTPPVYLAAHRERLRLASIQEFGSDNTTKIEPYIFSYAEEALPPRHSPHQDFWGYYNGDKSNTLLPQVYIYKDDPLSVTEHKAMYSSFKRENATSESLIFPGFIPYGSHDRTTDESLDAKYIQAGTLKKIDYPTKGWISFEYEPNSFYWSYGSSAATRIKKGGGLRVKKILNSEGVEKTYEYLTPDVFGVNLTSGKLIDLPLFAKGSKSTTSCSSCSDYAKLKAAALLSSNSYTGTSNVIYGKVTEKTKTAGKVVHTFNIPISYGKNIYNETGLSGVEYKYDGNLPVLRTIPYFNTPFPANYAEDLYPFAPKSNLDWTRGLPLTKEYYDETMT